MHELRPGFLLGRETGRDLGRERRHSDPVDQEGTPGLVVTQDAEDEEPYGRKPNNGDRPGTPADVTLALVCEGYQEEDEERNGGEEDDDVWGHRRPSGGDAYQRQ